MSINEQPLVTVYIPTFNRLELLQRAVESVRNQTYKNLEIIVVDDCSTDGTQEYLAQLAKEDSRVRYFLKEKNSGACVSRNIAIENATGEFITGLDDDDYFLEIRIEDFLKNWKQEKNIHILFSRYIRKTEKGLKIDNRFFLKKIVRSEDLLIENYIGNQIFTKTIFLKDITGFDENLKMWQDLECWYRLLANKYVAKRINGEATYVVDLSHSHERISNASTKKVIETVSYFSLKHDLDLYNYQKLINHTLNYLGGSSNFFLIIRKLFWFPSLTNVKKLYLYFIK